MLRSSSRRWFSPSLVISLTALFVALGGTTYAATGGNFILGKPNSADQPTSLSSSATSGPALQLSSTGGKPAASFTVASGNVAPLTVNSKTKVAKLNADYLDGLDSNGFLRKNVPLSLSGSTSGSVLRGINTGSGGGVYGKGGDFPASGVYGEGSQDGYGIAGRAYGTHGAIYGQNLGTGPALELHAQPGVPPISVDSSAKVANLNADLLDGKDATDFLPADSTVMQGQTYTDATTVAHGDASPVERVGGLFSLALTCPSSVSSNIGLDLGNSTTDPMNVFVSNSTGHRYQQIASNAVQIFLSDPVGEPTTFLIQGTPGGRQTVATVEVGAASRTNDCHFQMQALVTQK